RDDLVTGVQTCALPIFTLALRRLSDGGARWRRSLRSAWLDASIIIPISFRADNSNASRLPARWSIVRRSFWLTSRRAIWIRGLRSEERRVGKGLRASVW